MHTTDPRGLFSLLAVSEQSGMLTLWPSSQPKSAWQARFTLVRGQPTVCEVRQQQVAPVVVNPEQCLASLATQQVLEWELEEPVLPPVSLQERPVYKPQARLTPHLPERVGQPSPLDSGGVKAWHAQDRPCRLTTSSAFPAHWTRLHRNTFALIDGQRTVGAIAFLLHRSAEDIQALLLDCAQSGWIGKTHQHLVQGDSV